MSALSPPERASRLCLGVFLLQAGLVQAGSLGMVSDNSAKRLTVFDAELDTVTASLVSPPGHAVADCSITSNQRYGFSTSAGNEITVIELDNVTGLTRSPEKRVAISNIGVDMALSPDDAFLVLAGGGAIQEPLSVIDTHLQQEVATAGPFADHTSVEFCDDGTLLVTTTYGRYFDSELDFALYDAGIDHHGNIGLNGHRLSSGAEPSNSACAPGSYSGVLLDRAGGLTSFTLPGLRPAEQLELATGAGHAATFSADGKMLFVRTQNAVEAFRFDPGIGALQRAWIQPAPGSLAYYGIDQIALHPDGSKLYIDGLEGMVILDPLTGANSGAMKLGNTTGICFARTRSEIDAARIGLVGQVKVPAGP